MSQSLNRRQFVRTVAVGAGAVCLLPRSVPAARPWRFFSSTEAELVEAITEQIIPADEDPGARDARVISFIDKQLLGPYRRHQTAYHEGLAGVDETSREMFGKGFTALAWDDQTAVLKALESGQAKGPAWQKKSSASFFNLIRSHTMQGFYGSPRHGGNRGWVSYKMLGLDYPPIIGQNRYRKS